MNLLFQVYLTFLCSVNLAQKVDAVIVDVCLLKSQYSTLLLMYMTPFWNSKFLVFKPAYTKVVNVVVQEE
jgi:hypothetical protein